MGIEEKVSPGLMASVTDRPIPKFPDYSDDIKRFSGSDKPRLPFENQEKAFLELLRSLSTKYPYAVLIGDSGIGKSMMLDYFLSVMTDDGAYNEMKKILPEGFDLITNLRKKVSEYQRVEHFLLPNLFDPSHVVCISYKDRNKAEQDYETAGDFCEEMISLLENFGERRRDEIRKSMSEKHLRKYLKTAIDDFFIDVYSETREMMLSSKQPEESKSGTLFEVQKAMKDKYTYSIDMRLPDDFNPESTILKSIQFSADDADYSLFKEIAGFTQIRQVSKSDIEKGVDEVILDVVVEKRFKRLMYDIMHIDIDDRTDSEKVLQMFREEFDKYPSTALNVKISRGQFKTQEAVLDYLGSEASDYSFNYKVSEVTIRSLRDRIAKIQAEYNEITDVNPELKAWMNSVCDYFIKDKYTLKESLDYILDRIEDIEDEEGGLPLPDKKDGKDKKGKKKPSAPKDPHYNLSFRVEHGKGVYNIEELLTVNYLDNRSPKKLSWTKVGDMSSESFFASFIDPDEEDMPPHNALYDMGTFFSSGILVFNDSFKDFVDFVVSDDNKKVGMRERFLEYLQTGKMTLVNAGITYQIFNPQIIVGCDNDDPFVRIQGLLPVEETGLRGRIKLINTPSITRNTPENREGTLRVMHNSVRQFNEKYQSNINISPEAANMLLASMIPDEGFVNLRYREFTASLDDLCAYAVSKRVKTITSDFIKQKTRDDLPVTIFYSIEREKDFGGYFDAPEKQVGAANGLWVSENFRSGRVRVRSYSSMMKNPKEDDMFELVDITAEMTDENTIKGYDLAKDYVRMQLGSEIYTRIKNARKMVKTVFDESWNGIGGPSASMVITSSIMSVLSGVEIYKNRFMTGTINPHDGSAGMIGGTYHKGLVPMHLKELSDDGKEMYFLFPAGNLKDLTKDMIFDPFDMEKKISCFPVLNFPQAFYLLTCGPEISHDNWVHSVQNGKDLMSDLMNKIGSYVPAK